MEAKSIGRKTFGKMEAKDKAAICARFALIPLGWGAVANVGLCIVLAIVTVILTIIMNIFKLHFSALGAYIWGGVFGLIVGFFAGMFIPFSVIGEKKFLHIDGYENYLEKGKLGLSGKTKNVFMKAAEKKCPFRPKTQLYPYLLLFLLELAVGAIFVILALKFYPAIQASILGEMVPSQQGGPGQNIGIVIVASFLGASAALWAVLWFIITIRSMVILLGSSCKKCGYYTFEVITDERNGNYKTEEQTRSDTRYHNKTGTLYVDGKKVGTVDCGTESYSVGEFKRTVTSSNWDEDRMCPCCGHRYTKHMSESKATEWKRIY